MNEMPSKHSSSPQGRAPRKGPVLTTVAVERAEEEITTEIEVPLPECCLRTSLIVIWVTEVHMGTLVVIHIMSGAMLVMMDRTMVGIMMVIRIVTMVMMVTMAITMEVANWLVLTSCMNIYPM